MDLQIKTDRHLFVSGRTRTGKSEWVKHILYMYPRVIFHDRKHEHWDLVKNYHFSLCGDPDELVAAIQHGKSRMLYMPKSAGAADATKTAEAIEMGDFNSVCWVVFNTWNVALVIDEAASYCPNNRLPYWAGELYRVGAGRGIGVLGLTQRPRDVHNTLLSESDKILSFQLSLETDRKKLVQVCGDTIPTITTRDWRIAIGDWDFEIENVVDGEDKERRKERERMKRVGKRPVMVDEVLRTLPEYHFFIFDAITHQKSVSTPIPIH